MNSLIESMVEEIKRRRIVVYATILLSILIAAAGMVIITFGLWVLINPDLVNGIIGWIGYIAVFIISFLVIHFCCNVLKHFML